MLSYPYIESLFRAILTQSQAIQGRFYVAPYWGTELNAGNLNQLVEKTIGELPSDQKYPLCLMMPPLSTGDFTDPAAAENPRIVLLFLAKSFANGDGSVKDRNPLTGTSTHSIVDDWHEMKRCAVDFMRVLREVQTAYIPNVPFGVSSTAPQTIVPVSTIGTDRLSGVMLQFSAVMRAGCGELEDYASDYLTNIQPPF